jgi:hypothetical protein
MASFRTLSWALALLLMLGGCTQQPAADASAEAAPAEAPRLSEIDPVPDSLKHLVESPPAGKEMGAFAAQSLPDLPLAVMAPAGSSVFPAEQVEGGQFVVADDEGFYLEVSPIYQNLEDLALTWRADKRFRSMLTYSEQGMIFSTLREGGLDFHMEYVVTLPDGQRFRLRSFNDKRPFSRWQANKMFQAARLTQQAVAKPA